MHEAEVPLGLLPMGRRARVSQLTLSGAARLRLLDLGVVNGTVIEPLYRSPSGNPVAYLIRGAVIALREDISAGIMVIC